jgi:hypothetical protein
MGARVFSLPSDTIPLLGARAETENIWLQELLHLPFPYPKSVGLPGVQPKQPRGPRRGQRYAKTPDHDVTKVTLDVCKNR